MGEMHDGRSDYPNDFRLYDDMRGWGGPTVSTDFGAILLTIERGAFNLHSHEVGHQFYELSKKDPALSAIAKCNLVLFDRAQKTGRFITPYSKTNDDEFFAEIIAADRFDFSRMKTEFQDYDAFRTQILAGGDFKNFKCP
jgi:hypothetical protein